MNDVEAEAKAAELKAIKDEIVLSIAEANKCAKKPNHGFRR